jgi:hypothetical protein
MPPGGIVDDAISAIMPTDPEMIQVGDAIWQGPQWRSLIQGTVRPVRIVEILVLPQHRHQVALVPDEGLVEQLTSAAADQAFHDRMHPRSMGRRANNPRASSLEQRVECGGSWRRGRAG